MQGWLDLAFSSFRVEKLYSLMVVQLSRFLRINTKLCSIGNYPRQWAYLQIEKSFNVK